MSPNFLICFFSLYFHDLFRHNSNQQILKLNECESIAVDCDELPMNVEPSNPFNEEAIDRMKCIT